MNTEQLIADWDEQIAADPERALKEIERKIAKMLEEYTHRHGCEVDSVWVYYSKSLKAFGAPLGIAAPYSVKVNIKP